MNEWETEQQKVTETLDKIITAMENINKKLKEILEGNDYNPVLNEPQSLTAVATGEN